ncbi:bifunctional diguanylate cyclase/phosphodiesterase [Rhodopseudomonas sp. NSM]|uniref:bifunctional diguanylate cyclase/phosphodiesterase n=1 Tax=Rhodopseudomonas sp. NSM TaxID=3457630 RepID=UPI0040358C10
MRNSSHSDTGDTDSSTLSERFAIGTLLSHRPVALLMGCGLLLIIAIAVVTTMIVGDFRTKALQNSERELANTAMLLAHHYNRELEDFLAIQAEVVALVRQAQVDSADAFSGQMATLKTHEMLRAKAGTNPEITGLAIFNDRGTLINNSSHWPVPELSIAEQSYFQAHKAGIAPKTTVELVQNTLAGGWTIVLAQRLNNARGEFVGVVSRSLTPAHFEYFLASVSLGGDSAISLHHSNGVLMARYPHADDSIGRNLRSGKVAQLGLFESNVTMQVTSPVDGRERLVSSYSLASLPIVVVTATTTDEALAAWRKQTKLLISAATVSALVVSSILLLIIRQLGKQHHATQARLALDKQRLNTAINNMSQGLLLFDASQHLVVCNQRYIQMYGLSPEIVKPGCSFRDIIAHRHALGSFKGDIDEYCNSIVQAVMVEKSPAVHGSHDRAIQISSVPVPGGGWVATHEDITERIRDSEKIAYLAHYDSLTDLPNRSLFRQRLERELHRNQGGAACTLLYIDIDEFKSINDTLGHPIGDELLKQVAVRLRECVGASDFVARLGGDEFAVIASSAADSDQATILAERILQTIRAPYHCLGHHLSTDASIGIAIAPGDGADIDQLIKNADLAMYSAKAGGRRTFRFFEPAMDAIARARRELEFDLRTAIADGGFEIHYQPLVDLRSDAITGCEALLRWRHPTRGMISPVEFIPIAEDTGLINEIGAWTLAAACAEAVQWDEDITLAVNISPVQFRQPTLALLVASVLGSTGLPARRLELEVTEAVLIHDDDAALTTLNLLRALGVKISLDDFGTGYSSLSYLQRFPFDKIKIDRAFVENIDTAEGSTAIVEAVVNIAASRRMTTTAEGVETIRQRDILRALGCTQMQGWLFSPAVPSAKFRMLLSEHRGIRAA